MKTALPSNQLKRLEVQPEYEMLSTDAQVAFDDFVRLAAQICHTPIAIINLIDSDRQWFNTKTEILRDVSLCQICVQEGDLVIISDTLNDERTKNHSAVTSYPHIRFYAGIPLILAGGEAIGTLCVMDQKSREITAEQLEALEALARQLTDNLELRYTVTKLKLTNSENESSLIKLRSDYQQATLERDRFFSLSLDLICIAGFDGYFKCLNPAFEKALGYSQAEILATPFINFVHPDDRTATLAVIENLNAGLPVLDFENRYRCRDGSYKWLSWKSISLLEEGLIYATARDMTETKLGEVALKESEERWQLALRGNNDGIWDWNLETNQVFFSARWKEMLGYADSEICNHVDEWIIRVHPDDFTKVMQAINEHLDKKTPFYINEHRLLCKNGTYKWILDRGQALWNEENKPMRMVGSHTDITERKQAEVLLKERQNSLAQQEELLRKVLNAIPVGVLITNKQGKILQANPAAYKIWGVKKENFDLANLSLGLNCSTNSNSEQFKAWWTDTGKPIEPEEWAPYLAIIKGEVTLNECIDIQRFDRTRKTILNSAIPLRNDRQEIIGSIVVNQDITEQQIVKQALWENQRLFQQIADATPEILYLYDLTSDRNIYVNKQITEILGYSPPVLQQIEGLVKKLVHPEDLPKLLDSYKRLAQAKDGEVIESEYRMQCANGEWCWLISRDVVFSRTAEGSPHQILGTASDITKRKQAEVELREMSMALANAVEGISRLDAEGYYRAVNKAYANACGYEPEEMLGMLWYKTVHPDDVDKLTSAYQEMLSQGKVEVEARGIRKDRSHFYKQVVMVAAYNKEKQFIGHHCFMKDITERKESEQKIREQAALLDIATDAIFVKDINSKILFWNQGAQRLYGWTAAEAIGKDANEFLYKNPIDHQQIRQTLLTKGKWQGELRKVTKNGQEIIVESRWTLVYDQAGKPKSILVVNTDITEKKQLEAQFLRAQRMESLGTLASGIAHDLNNILAPILMAVQLLELQLKDERSMRLLPILKNNAKRGAELVKQVLSFGRGIQGDRTIVQIRHLVTEIRHIAKETFPKSIELYADLSSELWTVLGDATQLHQVLMNLCVNARDAMPNGGTLSICGENIVVDENYAKLNIDAKVGRYIVVTIADTGSGISAEIVDRIFEPFFTTKELGKGTGLGLSTVLGIVKSHGGFINVYSELGKGTEFKVYLPAIEAQENQEIEEAQIPKGSGELILIVDDETAIRDITKTSLESHGYKVISACDGQQAIATYKQNQDKINLVLLDMMMPNMDGSTTINEFQKINPNLSIIAMSGLTANAVNAEAASQQVKGFLSKPFTAEELLVTMQKVLHKKAKNGPEK
ncbi:PAS domain S-box protein [Aerosakkonemataceae cyanobacterium BLCC-F154]|uniref:histidine kinase n=1 Tax=Floridaenema fluviatile BLCC-F154 TaxID=3153640 RepID=A0ABV4YID4_9CYAN